jgi:hypothetical protein
MRIRHGVAVLGAGFVAALFVPAVALAAPPGQTTVTPNHQLGWSTADTRPGGDVNFVVDSSAPKGDGALQLTTDATAAAKAQYMHDAQVPLSSVNSLSYSTKQNSASFVGGDPSYQLPVYLDGTPASFTTLVYEPYENGTVIPGAWQSWDVDSGQFWSSKSFASGTCAVVAGGGGAPFYTLASLKTLCPNAVVVGYGVNIGSNNPSYDVETDLFNFNGLVYDFEPATCQVHSDHGKCGSKGL